MLEGTDKFLVDVMVQSSNRISVFFDGDEGVSISDCQKLSRMIEEKLNREFTDFELNVSSPGLDRPLKPPRQYRKHIGKEMEVVLQSGETATGIMVNAGESGVELTHPVKNPKKEIQRPNTIIRTDQIKSIKNVISFGKHK